MLKVPSHSWQAREALALQQPFNTYGAFRASGPERLPFGHRLPDEWAERYESDYDRITYVVWSYSTPIAWVLSGGDVVKVGHKWSITTSKHQGMLYALDCSQETFTGITEAAARERQQIKDRRAEARERAWA